MTLNDKSPMPHGDHEGTAMINVPADYLLWLRDQDWFGDSDKWADVREYIEDNVGVLEDEDPAGYEPDYDYPDAAERAHYAEQNLRETGRR